MGVVGVADDAGCGGGDGAGVDAAKRIAWPRYWMQPPNALIAVVRRASLDDDGGTRLTTGGGWCCW